MQRNFLKLYFIIIMNKSGSNKQSVRITSILYPQTCSPYLNDLFNYIQNITNLVIQVDAQIPRSFISKKQNQNGILKNNTL